MTHAGRMLLGFAFIAGTATAPSAQDAEDAYRMRASIYTNRELVTAVTWVAVADRSTTVRQTFITPYRRDTALSRQGQSAEDTLTGEVTMVVRPFRYHGTLCLNVEIDSHTVSQLFHYRSDSLLEVLPGGGGFGAGGDYCDSTEAGRGLLFNLSHGNEEDYAEILVVPEDIVREPN